MQSDPTLVHSGSRSGFLHRFIGFIVNHPWLCIFLCLGWVGLSSLGLQRAQINVDHRALFAEDNIGLQRLDSIENEFSRDDSLIILVRPDNGNVFTESNLRLIQELTERAWSLPHTLRVDSLTNFQHTLVEGDDLTVVDLVPEAENLSASELKAIRDAALSEPNLVNNVVSQKGHAAAIIVSVLTDERSGEDSPQIVNAAEEIRSDLLKKYDGVTLQLAGMVAIRSASLAATETELTTTSIYSTLGVMVCLFIMLRSFVSVLQTLLVVVCSILVAVGTVMFFGFELSPVMAGAPAIILTLAVADSIHLLISYQQMIRRGLVKKQAMYESLRVNMQPVFLTSLTTAVGFLFLNSSKSPPFAEMANTVSIGVMAAWLLSMILLPALVMVLPQQKFRGGDHDHRIMDAFADFVVDNRIPVLVVSCVVFGGIALLSVKNEFNDIWEEYYDETFEVRRATDFMVQEITGNQRIQFAFPASGPAGIMDPEYMEGLDRFAHWARQHEHVRFISTYSDTIKRLNRDMNGGDPAFYVIPHQRELISQYSLMFQMSLPFGLGLENQINMDQSAVRVNVVLGGVTSNDIMDFEQESSRWIRQNLPAYMHTSGIGFNLLLGELSLENAQGMLQGTALAIVVVSLLLIIALRSFRYGLLSMLPNLFPAIISFGIWALIDGQIGISTSIVACMTLGIVIDNTVHFLSKYLRVKRENNLDTMEATRYAFKTVGVALVATTLVISANFGMMAFSHYYPNASMGSLTAITVAVALSVNFLFFVPLLLLIDGGKGKGSKVPAGKNQPQTWAAGV